MKLKLVTEGFLKLFAPLPECNLTDARAAAALERMREDARWREYDRPSWLRMNRQVNFRGAQLREQKPAPQKPSNVVHLSSLIRRQAE